MGVHYAIYYTFMMTVPALAGKITDIVGNVGVVISIGFAVLLISIGALRLLRKEIAAQS